MDFNTQTRPDDALKSVQSSDASKPAENLKVKNSRNTDGVIHPNDTTNNAENDKDTEVVARPKRSLRGKRVFLWVTCILIFAVSCAAIWFAYKHFLYQGVDTARYQAVYLDNNNVYFGKVKYLVNGDILLQDVFRVQAEKDTNSTTSDASTSQQGTSGIRLIKPGKELHSPDDKMLINKDKVLFIENLKTDGQVTQAIQDYREGKTD